MPMSEDIELTILMPCLNEAETIGTCVEKATGFLRRRRIDGEVLVADNGALIRGANTSSLNPKYYTAHFELASILDRMRPVTCRFA